MTYDKINLKNQITMSWRLSVILLLVWKPCLLFLYLL